MACRRLSRPWIHDTGFEISDPAVGEAVVLAGCGQFVAEVAQLGVLVAWDATGPDRDDQFAHRLYTAAELTPLPAAPDHSRTTPDEQLSLFGGAP